MRPPRFRVIRGGLDGPARPRSTATPDPDATDAALARGLRAAYPAPGEGYWDGLEARVMAAVRVGRAAPATAAEWWHTLARWARPGLAAAAVVIGVVGGVAVQSHGARTDAAYSAVLEEEPAALEPLAPDAELARAVDAWGRDTLSPSAAAEERAAADLLSDGVKRRQRLHLDLEVTPRDAQTSDSAQARREATFRYVMP